MAYNTKVTETMFAAIKLLLENGSSQAEASRYMKLSDFTVGLINKAENYQEYKNIRAAMAMKKKENYKKKSEPEQKTEPEKKEESPTQVIEHRQSVTIQATHYMMTELQKTNEYLKLISNKLAFIVDELCGTKKEG